MDAMTILLTGGTGFIGKPLTRVLLQNGYTVYTLTRSPESATQRFKKCLQQYPDQLHFIKALSDISASTPIDAIINLAGKGIVDRLWTTSYRHKIWDSRVQLTLELSKWIRERATPPKVMISGSAVGYYGDHQDKWVYEETKGKPGFAHELCRHWEQAALSATRYGCRVCCLRIATVLATDGGFIQKLEPMCKLGAGFLFGNGQQWFPWIHRDDLINIILTALLNDEYFSAINAVALEPCSQKTLIQSIGRQIGQPFWIPIPKWLVMPMIGEMSDLFYASIKASPNRLTGFGYQYLFPTLSDALQDLYPNASKVSAQR